MRAWQGAARPSVPIPLSRSPLPTLERSHRRARAAVGVLSAVQSVAPAVVPVSVVDSDPGFPYQPAAMGNAPVPARPPKRDLLLTEYAQRAGVCRCCEHPIKREERAAGRNGLRPTRGQRRITGTAVQVWCDHCDFLGCRQHWRRHGHANALCRGNRRPVESEGEEQAAG